MCFHYSKMSAYLGKSLTDCACISVLAVQLANKRLHPFRVREAFSDQVVLDVSSACGKALVGSLSEKSLYAAFSHQTVQAARPAELFPH